MSTTATLHSGKPLFAPYTPVGTLVGGDVVVVGDAPMIAVADIPAGKLGSLATSGALWLLPKAVISGAAIGAGIVVYWNAVAKQITTVSSGNKVFGLSVEATVDADEWILVLHEPGGLSSAGPPAPSTSVHTETGAAYSVGANSEYMVLADATAASQTMNLPASGSNRYVVKKKDVTANTVTLDPAGAATIDGSATAILTIQHSSLTVIRDGSGNWWIE